MTNTANPRSYIDRVLRLKEEADALAEDAREVYREATANGLNQKALSQAVGVIRKRKKHGDKQADLEATTAEYVDAYYGDTKAEPRAAHAPAREGGGAAAAPERPEGRRKQAKPGGAEPDPRPPHNPATGELTEPAERPSSRGEIAQPVAGARAEESAGNPSEPDIHYHGQSAQEEPSAAQAGNEAGNVSTATVNAAGGEAAQAKSSPAAEIDLAVPDFLRRSDKGCNAMGVG